MHTFTQFGFEMFVIALSITLGLLVAKVCVKLSKEGMMLSDLGLLTLT